MGRPRGEWKEIQARNQKIHQLFMRERLSVATIAVRMGLSKNHVYKVVYGFGKSAKRRQWGIR